MDITERLSMPEMQKIVEDGARAFEAVEQKLDKTHGQFDAIIKAFDQAKDAQMLGALEHGRLRNMLRAAQGQIGQALALTYEVHQAGTAMAQKHNVDIPVVFGGGGR